MWLCTKHDNIEPTNNLAERQLRQYVIWRKMSFGTQSGRGSEYIAKSMSITATCRQSGINAFETFTDLISNAILGTPKTIQNYLPL
jgi:transposase